MNYFSIKAVSKKKAREKRFKIYKYDFAGGADIQQQVETFIPR